MKSLRLLKKPCEVEALRRAEGISREGVLAMMRASKPGMYEYQYKAEWDYALAQCGVISGFPPIISAGQNNFCIHYYAYSGQAGDGDMILNDVGAVFDNMITDISRAWPCNGRFSERQKLLYTCAYNTSNYIFGVIKPGMPMNEVDATIRRYNYEQLHDAGVCTSFDEIGTYMWHGGAHHIGFDVHDQVSTIDAPEMPLEPGMAFSVDIGIYHEEWDIGFRLEDNCLVTESGCENLSAIIPRSIEEIEGIMGR
jgi:Xaa-Pro aminopeptidase